MNPFQHLFKPVDDENPLTEEELDAQDAEARKARIKYTRDQVRNGPKGMGARNMRAMLSGQLVGRTGADRRFKARRAAATKKKATRDSRRAYHQRTADVAVLRGHLIILGQIDCHHESTTFTAKQRVESALWVVQKFGARGDDGELAESDDLFVDSVKAARESFLASMGVSA